MLAGFPYRLREYVQLDEAFQLHPDAQTLEMAMRSKEAFINETANRILSSKAGRVREEGELPSSSSGKKANFGKPSSGSQAGGQGKGTSEPGPSTPKPSTANRGGEASTSGSKQPLGEGACFLCKGKLSGGQHPWFKCPGKDMPEYAEEYKRLQQNSRNKPRGG
jgi:hypothetical protein